jgi:1,4-dihydroxy-2-naphthoate octaprenyltransferase
MSNSTKRAIRRDISITKVFLKMVATAAIILFGLGVMNEASWVYFVGGIFCFLVAIMIWIPAAERTVKRLINLSE